jgi:hypothetical protein
MCSLIVQYINESVIVVESQHSNVSTISWREQVHFTGDG